MLSSAYIGYGYRSAYSTRSPCWRTKFCAALHHATSGRSLVLLMCPVGEVLAPLTLTIWSCRPSNYQPSAAEHFRLLPRRLKIHCLKTWHRHRLCDHSSSRWRLICSDSPSLYYSTLQWTSQWHWHLNSFCMIWFYLINYPIGAYAKFCDWFFNLAYHFV